MTGNTAITYSILSGKETTEWVALIYDTCAWVYSSPKLAQYLRNVALQEHFMHCSQDPRITVELKLCTSISYHACEDIILFIKSIKHFTAKNGCAVPLCGWEFVFHPSLITLLKSLYMKYKQASAYAPHYYQLLRTCNNSHSQNCQYAATVARA